MFLSCFFQPPGVHRRISQRGTVPFPAWGDDPCASAGRESWCQERLLRVCCGRSFSSLLHFSLVLYLQLLLWKRVRCRTRSLSIHVDAGTLCARLLFGQPSDFWTQGIQRWQCRLAYFQAAWNLGTSVDSIVDWQEACEHILHSHPRVAQPRAFDSEFVATRHF